MTFLQGAAEYLIPFLILLTIVVFIHEFGHYLLARLNGVKVEVFSVGFGRELFGFTDKAGTRWKFSLIPLGGYVKMFGDQDAASTPSGELREMTEEERKVAFHHKRVGQRAAIVAAGPVANFILAVVLFAGVFMTYGQSSTRPYVDGVLPGSAAEAAGIQPGDLIAEAGGERLERFEELFMAVQMSAGQPIDLVIERDGERIPLTLTPNMVEIENKLGEKALVPQIGVSSMAGPKVRLGPVEAVGAAVSHVYGIAKSSLIGIGQMISGTRPADEISGPLRIAHLSGEAAKAGLETFLSITALLSVSLGLINLFPVPLLDGGHLLFYAFEATLRRPLAERTQEFGFRIGLILVIGLMLFATWNDRSVIAKIWDSVVGLVS